MKSFAHQRALALLIMGLCVISAATAIDEPEKPSPPPAYRELRAEDTYPNALGAAFGPITGIGLHYHRWAGSTGYQFTGGIIYFPPGEGPGLISLDYNLGGAIQWQLYGDRFAPWLSGNLSLFAGANHRGYIPVEITESEPVTYSSGSFQAEITVGPGIGIELILYDHLSIPVEFGYGASWTVTEPDLSRAIRVQLYGQTALRYRY